MSTQRYGVDLHTHTRYSDGTDTPSQLVAKAVEHGVTHLAVTDHDTVAALPEALTAAKAYGITVFTGIELSVQYQQYHDIHILGYCFDAAHEEIGARLSLFQEHRVQRGLEILQRVNRRLSALGKAPLDSQRILARVRGALARPHLAQELLAQGYVHTIQDAFREFLIPCDVPKATFHPEEAFNLIAQAGGMCSLAHPATISTDTQVLEQLLERLRAMGMVGVEAYHHCHEQALIDFLCARAQRYGLVVTGGSDYHGRSPGERLGHIAPDTVVPPIVLSSLLVARARGR
jgi:predicted metal-dependent phosphoesterase TrpH